VSDEILVRLSETIASRLNGDPAASYVAKLHAKGEDAALKKVGEEATEFVMACKDAYHRASDAQAYADARGKIVSEAADVWFHMAVAMARHNLSASDVLAELARREGVSGIEEKASRNP
jgi:phosphoribosyl-ATP pyrophosphohydrolase